MAPVANFGIQDKASRLSHRFRGNRQSFILNSEVGSKAGARSATERSLVTVHIGDKTVPVVRCSGRSESGFYTSRVPQLRDSALLLVDVFSKGLTGKQAEKALENAGITVNKTRFLMM